MVWFDSGPSSIDFIPKVTSEDFINLNGMGFEGYNCPVLKNNIFTEGFKVVKYLYLHSNEIQTIESNVFQHLPKLKWIYLGNNQIQSLPYQIFRNNPDLSFINFWENKIVSINPLNFDGLNKLKIVDFENNRCIDKRFGCGTCSVSEVTLKSELNECFRNCLSESECFDWNFLRLLGFSSRAIISKFTDPIQNSVELLSLDFVAAKS